jgi:hypothetical protein
MIDSSALLAALKAQLRTLQADLRERADDSATTWGAALQGEHAEALRRERTGLSWTAWRDNEVDQAAVAWILATTFVRFCEDNDLLVGAILDGMPVPVGWIAGPGDRILRARENQTAYFRINTSHHDRDWLQQSFRVLAAQPAGASLVDPKHNPVWTAEISAEAAKGLVDFWRRTYDDGTLVHDFTDPGLDTRFLGDLYQDLSDHAKKTYALLQTPVFVEEFILDRTLSPAIAEFGVDGLKLIDPTCGSGHFLLGGFERLNQQWATEAPSMDRKQRVRKAMDSIHGVDLNPFAVAIARFRLTVAGILAAGEKSMVGVEEWGFHLAIGDSLLGQQGVTKSLFGDDTYTYATEDLDEYADILKPGRYHVVVGNPPYITVKDKVLSLIYRKAYTTAAGKYALSVPFMELFFRLAIKGGSGQGAGHVGQITSNSFMKREFGKKVIEDLFAGYHIDNPVDLTHVIDTSGAYIPGHGTPTVILVGRRRRPVATEVRAVLGVRGEPGTPEDASKGLVWTEITANIDSPGFDGTYVSVADLTRKTLSSFPWSLSGGGAGSTMELIEGAAETKLHANVESIGFSVITGDDEFLTAPPHIAARLRNEGAPPFVVGDEIRDWCASKSLVSLVPTALDGVELEPSVELARFLWRGRTVLSNRKYFDKTPSQRGLRWFEYAIQFPARNVAPRKLVFAFVATHNHFVLDRGGKVFKQSAPVIVLPEDATTEQHLELLAVLNSSVACFWLKQVSHNKGDSTDTRGARVTGDPAFDTFEFTGTKLQELPLPSILPGDRGERLEALVRQLNAAAPRGVVSAWLTGVGHESLSARIAAAQLECEELKQRMTFEQEELDWETYQLYGLSDEQTTYQGVEVDRIDLGHRAFEVALARRLDAGTVRSSWFSRRGSKPITVLPAEWPDDYRTLVDRRLALMESDRSIRILERPEYKRRWASAPWDKQLQEALEAAILDRLEDAELWRDHQGPGTRSVAQLADMLRNNEVLLELARELTGNPEPDLVAVICSLAPTEAVPYLAAYRFKPSGLEKFREWQEVWDLQRREDAGEKVTIPIPPKYSTSDFQKAECWKARGKLDVPKERFVLYPGVGREGDNSLLLGWAGWSHRDQAVALVREIMNQQALGASNEALIPMIAGLVELEPWLHQWHTELEAEFGSSAAQAVTSQIDQFLAQLQMTRDDVGAWRPPAAPRGRRRSG